MGVSARLLGVPPDTDHRPQTLDHKTRFRAGREMHFSLGGWLPTCNSGARTDLTVAISRILLVRKMEGRGAPGLGENRVVPVPHPFSLSPQH